MSQILILFVFTIVFWQLEVYPNPREGRIQLDFKRELNEKLIYHIISLCAK